MGNSKTTGKKVNIDESLFEKIASGDENAFNELYYMTYKVVFSFIMSIVMNYTDAEDILQETYIKIRNGAHLYRCQGKPMSWIFKIAQNQSRMHIRKENRFKSEDIDDYEGSLVTQFEKEYINKVVVEEAFKVLNDESRQIVVLHIHGGLKHREIADILKLPLPTVITKYRRALKAMEAHVE